MKIVVDTENGVPPWRQVHDQVIRAVTAGALPEGARLPPIRQLARDLGLASGTVARAYRELEADAVIATRGRRGTFVHSEVVDEPAAHPFAADAAKASAAGYVQTVRRLGLSSQEALRLVENAWSQGELTAGR